MGFLTPRHPDGPGPERKPSRRERREAEVAAAQERLSTIGEADLRRFESQGWNIRRGRDYVIVERGSHDQPGGYEMRSFTVLGGGRYGKR